MRTYYQKVDLRSRSAMTKFLSEHFRYPTMNSWNRSTSYANNVKIFNLGLSGREEDKLYELIEMTEFYDRINMMLSDYAMEHNYSWQAGFNGRSGGYLVLYQGYSKRSEYKSFCTKCGQRNFKTVEETGHCRCGRCGMDTRVNYSTPPMEYGVFPGRGTDMCEDFEDWDIYSLRQRVALVQDFDRLCDNILSEVKNMVTNYEIEEDVIYVPQKVKVLKEAVSA